MTSMSSVRRFSLIVRDNFASKPNFTQNADDFFSHAVIVLSRVYGQGTVISYWHHANHSLMCSSHPSVRWIPNG